MFRARIGTRHSRSSQLYIQDYCFLRPLQEICCWYRPHFESLFPQRLEMLGAPRQFAPPSGALGLPEDGGLVAMHLASQPWANMLAPCRRACIERSSDGVVSDASRGEQAVPPLCNAISGSRPFAVVGRLAGAVRVWSSQRDDPTAKYGRVPGTSVSIGHAGGMTLPTTRIGASASSCPSSRRARRPPHYSVRPPARGHVIPCATAASAACPDSCIGVPSGVVGRPQKP